jgi:transcriptional regulator with XRE-family HTH domain
MPRKEKLDRGCAPEGTFGHMLFTARHKAGKSIAEMSRASGLSGPYLVHIERGIRSPIPDKVPTIATAYGINSSDASWSWILTFASKMMQHLLEDSPFLRAYQQTRRDDVLAWAEKEARMEYERSLADGKTRAECDANSETVRRFTSVGPRGPQPEIPRRIHEEYLEDKSDAGNTGNDDDRRP